ncbi:MAG: hypothetical protein EOP00_16020 [Pedobacter sp.]|nr:MAG: hypothetical protein EOP00_16020 [Pedobacter sp.]
MKQYSEANKEILKAYNCTRLTCPICGHQHTRKHKARHERSKYHQKALNNENENEDGDENK